MKLKKDPFYTTFYISLLISVILSLLTFTAGFSNRKFYPNQSIIIKISDEKDFLFELEKRKIRGRKIVIADKSSHAEIPSFTPSYDGQKNIENLTNLTNPQKINLNWENFIYLSILKGMIREVYLILPEKEWEKKKFDYWGPLLKLEEKSISGVNYEGTFFTISSSKNPILPKEKPILLVNPQLFPNWPTLSDQLKPDIIFVIERKSEEK